MALAPRVGPPKAWGRRLVRPPRRAGFTSLVRELTSHPRVLVGEVAIVVVLSAFFERLEARIRSKYATSGNETVGEIINALFKEITTLGFVGFVIFIFVHTGYADQVAPRIIQDGSIHCGGHNALAVTFETVHMMIFFLLVVVLVQAAAMYLASEGITRTWGHYERTVSYGSSPLSLESRFTKAGYLQKVPDPRSPTGMRTEEKKPFTYGRSWFSRIALRRDPLHKLVMWRAVRHEFLFPQCIKDTHMGGSQVMRVPDVGLFSFEEYLRTRMGRVVISLIHLDRWTWMITLMLVTAPLVVVKANPWIPSELVHCVLAWSLALVGVGMSVVCEQDTYLLTPPVPKQVTKILQLFSGESFQMLRRSKLPGWSERPLLEDPSHEQPTLHRAPALITKRKSWFDSYRLTLAFRMLSFIQAVSVTSLALSHFSQPLSSRTELVWYYLAWAEWPFMLFVVFPTILRRLTVRSSIAFEKDMRLIRRVTSMTKESLLRDYGRLVQLVGFERRSQEEHEPWTVEGDPAWQRRDALQKALQGLKNFNSLPSRDQQEIWALFAAWDGTNTGAACAREVSEAFKKLGVEKAELTVQNITRMVNYDAQTDLNWMKIKAIFGLATVNRRVEETREDIRWSFNYLDTKKKGKLAIFELADGFKRMHIGLSIDDIANLLFTHFGGAKPSVSMEEFVDFVTDNLNNQQL